MCVAILTPSGNQFAKSDCAVGHFLVNSHGNNREMIDIKPNLNNFVCTKLMGSCNKELTWLLTHWEYVFLALIHRNEICDAVRLFIHLTVKLYRCVNGKANHYTQMKLKGSLTTYELIYNF